MGAPDLLAKEVFAEEIPRLFGTAVTWQTGLELGLAELRLDGLLTVRTSPSLAALPLPWCHLPSGLVAVEVEMPGDHLDRRALQRALLHRQALAVTRLELEPPDEEPVALWMVAPHVPDWLTRSHRLQPHGAGCYRLDTGAMSAWWVATNELPLGESLTPLLVARSGKKLLELLRWSLGQRPAGWVTPIAVTTPEIPAEVSAPVVPRESRIIDAQAVPHPLEEMASDRNLGCRSRR